MNTFHILKSGTFQYTIRGEGAHKIYRFLLKAVFGKSGCYEEKCKPIIIHDADKAPHFVFPGTLNSLTRDKSRFDPIHV